MGERDRMGTEATPAFGHNTGRAARAAAAALVVVLAVACTPGDQGGTTTTTTPSSTTQPDGSTTTTSGGGTTSTSDPSATTTTAVDGTTTTSDVTTTSSGGSTTTTTIGTGTTTTTVPGEHASWTMSGTTLMVVSDGCESIDGSCAVAPEPYLIQIGFRSTLGRAGSSAVAVVHDEDATVACDGGCFAGSVGTVPRGQSTVSITPVVPTPTATADPGPTIAGSVLIAYDVRGGGDRGAATAAAQHLAALVRDALDRDVGAAAPGSLADRPAVVVVAVGALFDDIAAAVRSLRSDLTAPDHLVAIRPVVVVGATGTFARRLDDAGLAETPEFAGVASTLALSTDFTLSFDDGGDIPVAYDLDLSVVPS